MIPGNPGLIGYYEPFMKALRQLLDEREARGDCRYAFHIYGRNLLGFDDVDHEPAFGTTTAAGTETEPFSLEDQILGLCDHVPHVSTSGPENGTPFDEVILIGHSVGAYIALEVFNRHHHARHQHHQHHQQAPTTPPTPPLPPNLATTPLKSAILLFPTISHIAQSPSGRKLDLLRQTPFLDRRAHHLAQGLVNLVPRWLLGGLILPRVMGFPPHAAAATLRFLTGRDGIWQALHMGKDEMGTIGEEKWGEGLWEVWGLEEEEEKEEEEKGGGGEKKEAVGGSKFYFYFAEKDHWVADECRDEFIEKRARHEKGRTSVVVDEAGIPHAFCIRKSCLSMALVSGVVD
jgi:hypothetical protein